jgi:hypothetical protein
MMVAEHIADDVSFVRTLSSFVRPGGQVIVGVPGRRDRWGYEDEVAGHLRRYERQDLRHLLQAAGLDDVEVWSVSVPVANVLFHLGNRLVRRATTGESEAATPAEQTATSGIREIPWKTVFPRWCGLLLNRYTLAVVLAVGAYFGVRAMVSHIEAKGYARAMAEVEKRDAKAAIKGLMDEMRRDDRAQRIGLEHGDVVVWGGPARLNHHGVLALKDGHHALTGRCRINLTLRRAV